MILALLLFCGSGLAAANGPHRGVGVSFGIFYSSLGVHGDWVYAGNGVYGWRPRHVAVGWRPYYYGHWVWSVDGWFWVSAEPWAWAVYHYGRWYFDDYYGWVWLPGYDWAPAWVEWRYDGAYVGWAPLCPYAVFHPGFGIRYHDSWSTPSSYWTFVNVRYVNGYAADRYAYPVSRNRDHLSRAQSTGTVRYEGGRIISGGPDRQYLERRSGRKIPVLGIEEVSERGRLGIRGEGDTRTLEVYRPRLEDRSAQISGAADRPERILRDNRGLNLNMRESDIVRGTSERGGEASVRQPRRSEQSRRDIRGLDEMTQGRSRTDLPSPSGVPDLRRENAGVRVQSPQVREPKPLAPSQRPENPPVAVPSRGTPAQGEAARGERGAERSRPALPQVERRSSTSERSARPSEANRERSGARDERGR
jgi:hypothetical protein